MNLQLLRSSSLSSSICIFIFIFIFVVIFTFIVVIFYLKHLVLSFLIWFFLTHAGKVGTTLKRQFEYVQVCSALGLDDVKIFKISHVDALKDNRCIQSAVKNVVVRGPETIDGEPNRATHDPPLKATVTDRATCAQYTRPSRPVTLEILILNLWLYFIV